MFDGIAFLFKLCKKYNRKYIYLLVIKQIINILSTLTVLVIPKYIINSVFVSADYAESFYLLSFFLLLLFIFSFFSNTVNNRILVEKMVVYKSFQSELADRMMHAPLQQIESSEYLDLKSKAEQFIYSGGMGFCVLLEKAFDLCGKILTLILLIGIISTLSIELIFFLFVITICSVITNISLSRKNIKINLERSVQERHSNYFKSITQDFKYGKEIRANNCANWILSKYQEQLNSLHEFYLRTFHYSIKYGFVFSILSVIQQGVTYSYLITNAFLGTILVGDFSMYLSSINSFSTSLKELVSGIAELGQYSNYYLSFQQYYSISDPQKPTTPKNISELNCDEDLIIRFEQVYFKYPGSDKYALANISCEIKKGDVLSIVGDNGAGKSTFIKLLLKIYAPTMGKITLNGTDISLLDNEQYLQLFSSVFQDFQLFSFSVRDNITLGNIVSNSETHIEESLKFSGLYDKIFAFKSNVSTTVYRDFDNNGFYPSGGEAQRLALARAIYRNSEILILDEPTASLDPNIEYEINNRIREEFYNKKIIINVSHRLLSVRYSTKILVLNGGQLIEQGTHDQLIQQQSKYRQMFERQISDYISTPSNPAASNNEA